MPIELYAAILEHHAEVVRGGSIPFLTTWITTLEMMPEEWAEDTEGLLSKARLRLQGLKATQVIERDSGTAC